ncbi:two-component system response regulator NarL [Aromatoleum aromaticum]|uniref:Nitrate/nitrite TWO-component response regulator NARL n=1 Tax=Aromatoleum aromaticum (strain DSM 19018 / LMG 30748 / EbN1) TaxID=76114 RepID=Q5P3L2_AROAE|nr:two-component system response regulator NarL [Aromatoleum aromaticum]NMG55662.1 two-component system response regulator NarL [Aromatoleum aromaticum]CAI08102.1 Nitrate/nitrite TWO-component response regulator NARL [Aromatoleum aromaticum EbN1]
MNDRNDTPQSVVIIDDHPLFRKGLIQLLRTVPGFRLVAEAADGKEGIAHILHLRPDLLLLDLNMKDMSGLEVLKFVRQADLDTRVVMVTVSDAAEDLVAALRAGADGYLLKDMEPEQMVEALQAAAAGRIVVSDALTHLMAAALRQEKRPDSVTDAGLTEQEQRILERIAAGLSNKLIARELGIAEGTVKVHVKHVLRKLNFRSRVEAAVWAVANQRGER